QILILFDEMDQSKIPLTDAPDGKEGKESSGPKTTTVVKVIASKNDEYSKSAVDRHHNSEGDVAKDKLNFKFVLSSIDGIGNMEGLIIVGTSNHKEKFAPSLLRDGRLKCVHFANINKENMA